jgi:hypothetical protein
MTRQGQIRKFPLCSAKESACFSANLSVIGGDFAHGKACLDLYISKTTLMENERWMEGTGVGCVYSSTSEQG